MEWIVPAGSNPDLHWYVPVALLSVFCTGFGKAGFAGMGFLPVPLMMMVLSEARVAVGMWAPVMVVGDLLTIRHFPKDCRWDIVARLLPASMVGILGGAQLAARVPSRELKLAVGGLAIALVTIQAIRAATSAGTRRRTEAWQPSRPASMAVGLSAGFCSAVAHAGGVFINLFLLPQRLTPQQFVGTAARYFLVVNTLKLPFYTYSGLINVGTLKATLWLLPLAPLGAWAGARVNRRLSSEMFTRIVYVLVVLASLKLMVDQI